MCRRSSESLISGLSCSSSHSSLPSISDLRTSHANQSVPLSKDSKFLVYFWSFQILSLIHCIIKLYAVLCNHPGLNFWHTQYNKLVFSCCKIVLHAFLERIGFFQYFVNFMIVYISLPDFSKEQIFLIVFFPYTIDSFVVRNHVQLIFNTF